ncbi:unnamed protein product [Adineta steineri]|uniref:F-box domain-containing protein n=1 Tax=Adineta steineri TaxID=433720 RepID=A0A813ZH25_9BILA|nr:unnamed protein product [Adineta steineri]
MPVSFVTLPVELVYRILDYQSDITIIFSMRNVCQRFNAIVESYDRYQTITTLNLRWYEIRGIGTQHLANVLRNNTILTTLNLGLNKIGDVGTQHLADVLRTNTTLTALNLFYNQIGDVGAQHLADVLRTNTILTTLNLDRNAIGAAGVQHIADGLRNNTTLTILNLERNQIEDVGVQHLADALRTNSTLTTLNLGLNVIGNVGAQHLADVLRTNTTLTTLNLENNHIEAVGGQHLADALRNNTQDDADKPLGITIGGGSDKPYGHRSFPHIIIVDIRENGWAHRDQQLKIYDIILRINDTDVTNVRHLYALDVLKKAGATVQLSILRLSPPNMEMSEVECDGKLSVSIAGGIGTPYHQKDPGVFIIEFDKDQTKNQLEKGDRLLKISSTVK